MLTEEEARQGYTARVMDYTEENPEHTGGHSTSDGTTALAGFEHIRSRPTSVHSDQLYRNDPWRGAAEAEAQRRRAEAVDELIQVVRQQLPQRSAE